MNTLPGLWNALPPLRAGGAVAPGLGYALLYLGVLCCGSLGCTPSMLELPDQGGGPQDQADPVDISPAGDMARPQPQTFSFAAQTLGTLIGSGWLFTCSDGEAYFNVGSGQLTHDRFPKIVSGDGVDCWVTTPEVRPDAMSCVQVEIRHTVSGMDAYNGSFVGVYREPMGRTPEPLLLLNATPPGSTSWLVLPALAQPSMKLKLRLHAGRGDVIPASAWGITAIRLHQVSCPW